MDSRGLWNFLSDTPITGSGRVEDRGKAVGREQGTGKLEPAKAMARPGLQSSRVELH